MGSKDDGTTASALLSDQPTGDQRAEIGIPIEPTDRHLKALGYAPGNYISFCHSCQMAVDNLDKRAASCRECAVRRYASMITEWGAIPLPPGDPLTEIAELKKELDEADGCIADLEAMVGRLERANAELHRECNYWVSKATGVPNV